MHLFRCICWCWSAFHLYTLDISLLSQPANLCHFVIAHVCLSFVCVLFFLHFSQSYLPYSSVALFSSHNTCSWWCFNIFDVVAMRFIRKSIDKRIEFEQRENQISANPHQITDSNWNWHSNGTTKKNWIKSRKSIAFDFIVIMIIKFKQRTEI